MIAAPEKHQHLVGIERLGETMLIRYWTGDEAAVSRQLGEWAADAAMPMRWRDAVTLEGQVERMAREDKK